MGSFASCAFKSKINIFHAMLFMQENFIKLCEWAKWIRACGFDPVIEVHILGQKFSFAISEYSEFQRNFSTEKFKLDGIVCANHDPPVTILFACVRVATDACLHYIQAEFKCDLCGFGCVTTKIGFQGFRYEKKYTVTLRMKMKKNNYQGLG